MIFIALDLFLWTTYITMALIILAYNGQYRKIAILIPNALKNILSRFYNFLIFSKMFIIGLDDQGLYLWTTYIILLQIFTKVALIYFCTFWK